MAGTRDITIYKGDTYTHEVRIKNSANTAINISGRSYKVQMRKSKASDEIIASFTVSITNAANGVVTFSLDANTTSNISVGTYHYDFEETNGSYVTTLMGGKIIIVGEVSRG
jgi:LEA14-like dessication related protein